MRIGRAVDFKQKFIDTYNKKPIPLELIQFKEWYANNISFNHWNGKEITKKL